MTHRKFIRGPLFLLKLVLILAITSAIVMLLWNAIVPSVFNAPMLNYWQAAGLLLLAKILFGSIGRGFGRRHHGYPDEAWKKKLRAKYEAMSPEEKEKFRSKCRTRFSYIDIEEDVNSGAKEESSTN